MNEPISVANLNILESLPNHQDGEIAFVEDIEKYMMYKEGKWIPFKASVENSGLKIGLYELNKTAISQMPDLSPSDAGRAKIYFNKWVKDTNNDFYMLYGKELGYFTLFKKKGKNADFSNLFDGVLDLLSDLGSVKVFNAEPDENGVLDGVEIWVKQPDDNVTVLYLFPYDKGVVTYER